MVCSQSLLPAESEQLTQSAQFSVGGDGQHETSHFLQKQCSPFIKFWKKNSEKNPGHAMNLAQEEWPQDWHRRMAQPFSLEIPWSLKDFLSMCLSKLSCQRTIPLWTELATQMLLLLHPSVLSYSWRPFHAIVRLQERANKQQIKMHTLRHRIEKKYKTITMEIIGSFKS